MERTDSIRADSALVRTSKTNRHRIIQDHRPTTDASHSAWGPYDDFEENLGLELPPSVQSHQTEPTFLVQGGTRLRERKAGEYVSHCRLSCLHYHCILLPKKHSELPCPVPHKHTAANLGSNLFQTLHSKGINVNGRLPSEDPEFLDMEYVQNPTQPLTQPTYDERRAGGTNAGLSYQDESDILCILHPNSAYAIKIVNQIYKISPQHIWQNYNADSNDLEYQNEKGQGLPEVTDRDSPKDIALRMSSRVKTPGLGFIFGRNPALCDVLMISNADDKSVSNAHFRIYLNSSGIIMLQDMSTNGTIVDGMTVGGKKEDKITRKIPHPYRMINAGSIIGLGMANKKDDIKFVVRFPPRDGVGDAEYKANLEKYVAWNRRMAKEAEAGEDADADARRVSTPSTIYLELS